MPGNRQKSGSTWESHPILPPKASTAKGSGPSAPGFGLQGTVNSPLHPRISSVGHHKHSLTGNGKRLFQKGRIAHHKAQTRIFMHIFQPTTCGTFAKVRTYSHKSQQISRFLCKPVTFCRFLLYTSPKMIFSRGAYPFIMPGNPDMVHTLGTAGAPHTYGNSGAYLGNSDKEAVVVRRGNTPPAPDIRPGKPGEPTPQNRRKKGRGQRLMGEPGDAAAIRQGCRGTANGPIHHLYAGKDTPWLFLYKKNCAFFAHSPRKSKKTP